MRPRVTTATCVLTARLGGLAKRLAPVRVQPTKHTLMHFQTSTPGLIAPSGRFGRSWMLRASAGESPRAP
jgi:hypothetical protein